MLCIQNDDVDILIEKHGDVFPEDWDRNDLINFLARYAIANIEDLEEWFND